MKIRKIDHIGIVVNDLQSAIEFFTYFGFTLQGEASVGGDWADRVNGLTGTKVDIAMMQAPGGQISLELTKFNAPEPQDGTQNLPSNAYGFRHMALVVDDIEATVAGLKDMGYGLVAEIVNYQDVYKLCYVRGPEGIIVELAEELS